jgi:D-3-phosphoglycerate dehydrogenase
MLPVRVVGWISMPPRKQERDVSLRAVQLLFCGSGWFPVVDFIRERLPDGSGVAVWNRAVPLLEAARGVDVLLPSNGAVDADVITAAGALRLIQQPAAGVEGIDREAARRRGVPVCNAPGANHVAVAETALFLMLALARKFNSAPEYFARVDIGNPLGCELADKTLGVIGNGRSGKALARRASAFEMKIASVNSRSSRADLEELFASADVISIHCPLNESTRGLVDDALLSRVKPGAALINCARGAIVDRVALERALGSGRLAGVGLDTYWEEPWDPNDPLFLDERVIALPHVAGSTREAFSRIAEIVCENVRRLERGDDLLYRVDW